MASLLVRARLWVTLLWLAGFGALAPLALQLPERLSADSLVAGSESDGVSGLVSRHFDDGGGQSVWLVVTGVADLAEPAGLDLLQDLHDALQTRPWVTDLQSYLNTRSDLFLAASGEGGLIRVSLAPDRRAQDLGPLLQAAGEEILAGLSGAHPDLAFDWTGESLINADLLRLSEKDVRLSEARAVPVTALLLAWAFGALVAMVFPLAIAGLAIVTVFGLAAFVGIWWQPSVLLQNVVSLLGLALGIDYTLLMVSRFREELKAGLEPVPAAERTLRRAGRAVLLSGFPRTRLHETRCWWWMTARSSRTRCRTREAACQPGQFGTDRPRPIPEPASMRHEGSPRSQRSGPKAEPGLARRDPARGSLPGGRGCRQPCPDCVAGSPGCFAEYPRTRLATSGDVGPRQRGRCAPLGRDGPHGGSPSAAWNGRRWARRTASAPPRRPDLG